LAAQKYEEKTSCGASVTGNEESMANGNACSLAGGGISTQKDEKSPVKVVISIAPFGCNASAQGCSGGVVSPSLAA